MQYNFVILFLAQRSAFEYKRKMHYNEFYAVKLARKLIDNDGEEDELEENEENETNEKEMNKTKENETKEN